MVANKLYSSLFFFFSILYFPIPSTLKAQYPSRFEDYYIVGNPDSLENAVNKLQSNKEQYLHGLIELELNRYVYSNKFGQSIETINRLANDNRSELGQTMYKYLKGSSLIDSDKTAAANYLLQAKESFEVRKDTVGVMVCWNRLLMINHDGHWIVFGDSLTQKKCYDNIVYLGAASTSPYAKLLLYRTILGFKRPIYGIFNLRDNEDIYNRAVKTIDKYPRFEYARSHFKQAIAISYSHAKDYTKLLELQLQVHENEKDKAIHLRVTNAYNVGNAYLLLKDFNNAKKYLQIGVALWKENPATDKQSLRECYQDLAEVEFAQKHYNKAWDYRSKCDSLDEIMHKATISNSLIEAQTKYETLKKEAENNKLQEQVENNNRQIRNLILGIIAGSILSLLIVFLYGKTQNKNAELKRLNELTDEQNKALNTANKKLEHFSYALSHDALGYIKHILNRATMAKTIVTDPQAQGFIQDIHREASRLKKMAENLISYNKQQNSSDDRKFNLNTIITEVREDMLIDLIEADAELIVDELPCVYGNYQFTKQLFRNLLGNAVQYKSPDRPLVVHITAQPNSTDAGFVAIQVRDNGIGISPNKLDCIFKAFVKGSDNTNGTGLGLYICQQIVEGMGGKIGVESDLGVGTRFFFTLPSGAEK